MTDDELFVKSLQTILNQMIEERSEITRTDKMNLMVAKEYDKEIKKLQKIIPQLNCLNDIWFLTENNFLFAIECLELYADYFVLDGRNPELLKTQEEELNQLNQIISQFYEDEEDQEEEEFDE